MRRLFLGILCLLISIFIHSSLKWELKTWITSPLPRPESALILSGEFAPLMSDFFLVKAAVFYGNAINKAPKKTLWFAKVLYLASYLDPYYFEPYWIAGVILPWEGRVKGAKVILNRGLKYLPHNWELPFYLGFISFYFEHNNSKAAHYFFQASKLPKAPSYLSLLATRLAVKGNETPVAIAFLQTQLKNVKDQGLKKRLKKRLHALEAIYFLERALNKYKRIYGNLPLRLEDLVNKHIIAKIPSDPYGGKFYLTKTGRVWSTSNLH